MGSIRKSFIFRLPQNYCGARLGAGLGPRRCVVLGILRYGGTPD